MAKKQTKRETSAAERAAALQRQLRAQGVLQGRCVPLRSLALAGTFQADGAMAVVDMGRRVGPYRFWLVASADTAALERAGYAPVSSSPRPGRP